LEAGGRISRPRPLERDLIHLGNAPIPVLRDGKPVLLLEAAARASRTSGAFTPAKRSKKSQIKLPEHTKTGA